VHELALVQNVVDTVCARVGDRRVVRVRLRVGALVAVMPDALNFCFDVATQSTSLEGASLEIEVLDAKARCDDCDTEFAMTDGLPLCVCGSTNVVIVTGQELLIQEVEVAA
jgi:hydrogenase nickel incorporation protein HypA/HybF